MASARPVMMVIKERLPLELHPRITRRPARFTPVG